MQHRWIRKYALFTRSERCRKCGHYCADAVVCEIHQCVKGTPFERSMVRRA